MSIIVILIILAIAFLTAIVMYYVELFMWQEESFLYEYEYDFIHKNKKNYLKSFIPCYVYFVKAKSSILETIENFKDLPDD